MNRNKILEWYEEGFYDYIYEYAEEHTKEDILQELILSMKERNKYKEVLNKIRKNNERIIDYGFDYDGFNNVEDLKKLIDMLVDYAKQNDKLLEEIE